MEDGIALQLRLGWCRPTSLAFRILSVADPGNLRPKMSGLKVLKARDLGNLQLRRAPYRREVLARTQDIFF